MKPVGVGGEMTLTFYAQDNEFAAATGSNVNYAPDYSRFDFSPASTQNLVITSQAGDSDPRLFEVGEIYTISFQGSGAATINSATVTRSDYTAADDGTAVEGNEGTIVFEGLDGNGDLVQVVWTPNFDLETWYFNNFSSGNPPGFYTQDTDAATTARFACFVAGTEIRTPAGDRRIEDINPGDLVSTLDHGPVPVLWCARSVVPAIGRAAPVTLAAGVLGGSSPLTVSPQHRVLTRHPWHEINFGTAEVLVAARLLVDGEMVVQQALPEVAYHHILCERHEILFANGIETESMLLGDEVRGVMGASAQEEFKLSFGKEWSRIERASLARPEVSRRDAPLVRAALGLRSWDYTENAPPTLFPGRHGAIPQTILR